MKRVALIALCGCNQIFGLHSPEHGTVIDSAIDSPLGAVDAPPRQCTAISDCPTSVCLPDGTCAADGDVAWLVQGATATTPCTMATPCYRMVDALGTNRRYVRVQGSITNASGINQSVMFFGETGASLGQPGYNITISGATVGVYDLSFAGSCLNQNGASILTLEHVAITGCNGIGLNSSSGSFVIDRGTITNNRNGGIRVNTTGTVKFSITNTLIAGNNTQPMSDTGGINILSTAIDPTSRLDFNTIVDNGVKNGTTSTSGGVICDVPGFAGASNIIAHNNIQGSTTATNANTFGACTYPTSIIEADDTNLVLSTGNYHLGAGSVAIDAAMTPPITDHDIDGDHRPQGNGYDVGADEYP